MSSLPNPGDLQKYEQVTPGFGERLVTMAEREQRFRHRVAAYGQIIGLIIALSFLAASTYLIGSGHDLAGGVLGTVDIVALVTVFVAGKAAQPAVESSNKTASKSVASPKRSG